MSYRTTPEAVAELRRPWQSLVGEVPDLTTELEREFRFGQRVTYFNGSYRMGGNIKGGSSSIWYPAGRADYDAYLAWRDREGIIPQEDRNAFEELQDLLDGAGTELRGPGGRDEEPYEKRHGAIYRHALEAIRCLPWEHISGAELEAIQLGGWGPDSAKASAYDHATVMMYDFALKGARRTFVGLFLHELGHAHEKRLSRNDRVGLKKAFRTIVEKGLLIGVDYLLDVESRKAYQRTALNEFLAEMYMIYVSHGEDLRQWASDVGGEGRSACEAIYSIFQGTFGGIEYA